MKYRTKIDPRASYKGDHSSVTITGDALVIDIDEAEIAVELAKAGAAAIGKGIRAIPSDRGRQAFNVTGTLAAGITVERGIDGRSASVVAPPERLQRDPLLIEKLVDLVPALKAPDRTAELDRAIEKIETVKR